MEKISYSLGLNIAASLKSSGVEALDMDAFYRALKTAFEGGETEISAEEANQILQKYFTGLQSKMVEKAKAAGEAFLEENGKREEVTVLESGLQYEVLTKGDGNMPQATDQVKCHYHGTLVDGSIFDSSVQRGEPAVFPVNGVIQGWVEALQMMPVGSKWKLYVPSDLAYGERGAGQAIAPHATLIFEVELLEIV